MSLSRAHAALDAAPPIVRAAVLAILEHEERIDPMGYDISYYQADLPNIVADAIQPWVG